MSNVVMVEWEDTYNKDSGCTWVPKQDAVWEPLLVYSVGYVLYDGPEGIIITESVYTGFTGQRTQIPRGCIRSTNYLKEV